MVLTLLISFSPLVIYMIAVLWMDTYSITRRRVLIEAVLAGVAVAIACYYISVPVDKYIGCDKPWVQMLYPVLEEFTKALPLFYMLQRRRIASFLDAFVYGAAVGCAFAFVENIVYMLNLDLTYQQLVFRSISTSLMHAGCSAAFAMFMYETLNLRIHRSNWRWLAVLLCLLPCLMHIVYNNFNFYPNIKFISLIVVLSAMCMLSMLLTERKIKKWMFEKADSQILILSSIEDGSFYNTDRGKYFLDATKEYPQRVRDDMMNYIHLCLQISVQAKGRAMAKTAGFEIHDYEKDAQTNKQQLAELKRLERKLNFAAMNIVRPIARLSRTDRWSLQQ